MHIPVLKNEVIEYLNPQANENFVDATFCEGGHTAAILERNGSEGKVLAIEWDKALYEKFSIFPPSLTRLRDGQELRRTSNFQFSNRLILANDSYTNIKTIVENHNFLNVKGILFDLGLSSWHLEESGRGFSFKRDEPLDMRFDTASFLTAREIVNTWSVKEIEEILKEYGNERFFRRIAVKITEERKNKVIETTRDLVRIIADAVPARYLRKPPHFAARTFQALRIAVNDELKNIADALPQAMEVLVRGGRLVVISFHSGEDRIVKNFFKEMNKKGQIRILTKKPIRPTKREIEINARARSSLLRAGEKV